LFFKDKEAPKVIYCPKDQYVKKANGAAVTWPEPQFTDNVGVTSVRVTPYDPGTDLSENDYHIIYTAKDHAGNYATCEFNVFVTGEYTVRLSPR
jgi:hypothetical protein